MRNYQGRDSVISRAEGEAVNTYRDLDNSACISAKNKQGNAFVLLFYQL